MFERITNLYILIAMLNPQECTNLFKESLFERVEESNLRILRIPSLLPNIPQFFFSFLIIPCLTALARPKCLSCELHLWSINQLELSHPLAPKKKKVITFLIDRAPKEPMVWQIGTPLVSLSSGRSGPHLQTKTSSPRGTMLHAASSDGRMSIHFQC